jgi:hypothetical protein
MKAAGHLAFVLLASCLAPAVRAERESGIGNLEQAVAAYREALKEMTRERAPLDWATTQMNLGTALGTLGERESGTGKLEQAVAAFNACLAVTTPVWPADWVRFVETRRDATQAEIARRSAK